MDAQLMRQVSSFVELRRANLEISNGAGSLREYPLYGQEAATRRLRRPTALWRQQY